jgi:hypothetical protein
MNTRNVGEPRQLVDVQHVARVSEYFAELSVDLIESRGELGSGFGEFADLLCRGGSLQAPSRVGRLDSAVDLLGRGDLVGRSHPDLLCVDVLV